MNLENSFYTIGIILLSILLMLLIGIIAAMFIIRRKIMSIQLIVANKIMGSSGSGKFKMGKNLLIIARGLFKILKTKT